MDEAVDTMWKMVTDKIQKVSEQFSAKFERIEEFLNKINTKTDQLNVTVKSLQQTYADIQDKLSILGAKTETLDEKQEKKYQDINEQIECKVQQNQKHFTHIENQIQSNYQEIGNVQIRLDNMFKKVDSDISQVNSKFELHQQEVQKVILAETKLTTDLNEKNTTESSKLIKDEVTALGKCVNQLKEQSRTLCEQMNQNDSQAKLISQKVSSIQLDLNNNHAYLSDIRQSNEKLAIGITNFESKLQAETENRNKLYAEIIDNKATVLNDEISKLKVHLKEVQLKCQRIYTPPTYSWVIGGIEAILKRDTCICPSEIFPVFGYPFSAQAMFEIGDDGNAYISLAFIDEGSKYQPIPLKILPKVTYTLRDLTSNGKDIVRTKDQLVTSDPHFDNLSYERMLRHKSWLQSSTYNRDDSILLDITVETVHISHSFISNDGILAWKIENYAKSKQKAIDDLVWYHSSPYFYTSLNGHRVKVLVWLNGCDDYTGKGLTIGIGFLSGEMKSSLGVSFPHTTTVTLINQFDATKNLVKTVEMDVKDALYYSIDILSHKELENDGFIKDDCLFYKVVIAMACDAT